MNVYTIMMKRLKLWLPVGVWMLLIFSLSSRATVQVSPTGLLNFIFYKTLHLIEYALLYCLSFRATKHSWPQWSDAQWSFMALFIVVSYGMSDEFHQAFTPTREPRVRDVIIDAMGGGVGWSIIHLVLPKAPKKLQTWLARWQIM